MLASMSRLVPCSLCGRHVRSSDWACPFCGASGFDRLDQATVRAGFGSGAITTALLGLSLVVGTTACTSDKDPSQAKPSEPDKPAPSQPTAAEPTTAVPEPATTVGEPAATTTGETGDESGETSAGTDDGAVIEEPPIAQPKPRHPSKYGAPPGSSGKPLKPDPRAHTKYGAPPDPGFDPF